MNHTRWGITDADRAREGYQKAHRAYLSGKAISDRRNTLGMTQARLAARAGMTQAAISRPEHGGPTPTIPLLERLTATLDSTLHLDHLHLSSRLTTNRPAPCATTSGALGMRSLHTRPDSTDST